jgi:hypothetical protein
MELSQLLERINSVHTYFQKEAVQQVNTALSLRNWLIGFYLYEYEQQGNDRAAYGERLYKTIAARLKEIKGMSEPRLYLYKDFYLAYPQIFLTLSRKSLFDESTLNLPQKKADWASENPLAMDADLLFSKFS